MFSTIFRALLNILCGSSEHTQQSQPQDTPQHFQQDHQQPHRPQGQKPALPHRLHEDPNQINQQNEYYVGLRARANAEGDAMAKCFEQSHQAYSNGDKAGAKMFSNQGKDHQQKMESLNKEASHWIFIENNKDSKPGELDLHGLYVKEAIERTDQAIQEAKHRGDSELHIIVGKGLHSKGGVGKIKPAIEELMQKHQLLAEIDPNNAGVLIVQINSRKDRGMSPDDITRRLERDESCTIM